MADSSIRASSVRYERGDDGIVLLTLDDPDRSANTMNAGYIDSMDAVIERLHTELDDITGVVLLSAKKTFFAGGDLDALRAWGKDDAAEIHSYATRIKAQLRALETLGRPVVAALNGAALGGGLELALAAHHRVIADVRGAVVGFPEIGFGLLPGAGGIVRTVRMVGLEAALGDVLTTGTRYAPAAALATGLVDEVVGSIDELLPAARSWIAAHPDASQPWDQPGFRIPGGDANSPKVAASLPAYPATLRKQLRGAHVLAPRAILAAAVEGAQVEFDDASLIETRYFVSLVTSTISKNMISANFYDLAAVNAGASRPAGIAPTTVARVGILGAGMMGAGIAYAAAKVGIDVVLKDTELAAAERGKAHSAKLVAGAIERGRMTQDAADALLARITPTDDTAAFAGVDFVVEAVFESVEVKQQVFRSIESVVLPDAVLGSNTSTLPITTLATGVQHPESFIGVHFFSPVDRMPLVEIIVGEKTSDATLARAFDFSRQIGKTPIVVNDSRGFFTSRVIMARINEAVAELGEGAPASSIEQAGLQSGYPAGPLQLMDELTLTLPRKIRTEALAAAEAEGVELRQHGSDAVIDRMVDEFGRKGRSTGAGFYDYDDAGKRIGLWPGLHEHFGGAGGGAIPEVPFEDLQERMLFVEALETVRCLDEGVLRSVADANVGSLLGIGFPPWTGGVLRYIDSYEGGLVAFVDRARELSARYGARFDPPESLVARAASGDLFG